MKDVEALRSEALAGIAAALDEATLERARVEWLGRKGPLMDALRGIKDAPAAERRDLGLALNRLRDELEAAMAARQAELRETALAVRMQAETLDVTLPGRPRALGGPHPLQLAEDALVRALRQLGFRLAEGPEVESEELNFEALNIPKDHPAREMHDTFFVADLPGYVLRTHTSPVQIRSMRAHAPAPVRIITVGRVYRRDDDVTHSPVFHQMEGLAIGEGIGMQHLKATLYEFCRAIFGRDVRIRLRPSYFPFTEPSAEVDIGCVFCGGNGCRICKGTGFIEILGSGMVHPHVLREGGYDPQIQTGFAFGVGVERIAMLRYGIDDVRLLFQNDLRLLRQF
ncbi:MAG: phenylalanine--tRNA ligase subunit alpha [Thermaerobacter sp.]|nr:phenylalanine--tRNA ligase subunit alpha [Thermaerobacter sp.]